MNTIYVFVDKELSPAQRVVQVGHAILESQNSNNPHPYIIVFGIKRSKMYRILKDTEDAGYKCTAFYEPDIGHKLTAFCTSAIPRSEYFRKFQLLK